MDMFKKTLDRAKQTVGETFGDAPKTEYTPEFQAYLHKADDIHKYTEKLLNAIEMFHQPDPAIRLLPGMTHDEVNKPEWVGQQFKEFATQANTWAPQPPNSVVPALNKAAETFQQIGKAERDLHTAATNDFFGPIKGFIGGDLKNLDNERKTLGTNRLDMDSLKNRAQKNPTNAPLCDELRVSEMAYEAQQKKVIALVNDAERKLPEILKHLQKFLGAQNDYYKKSQQAVDELYKSL